MGATCKAIHFVCKMLKEIPLEGRPVAVFEEAPSAPAHEDTCGYMYIGPNDSSHKSTNFSGENELRSVTFTPAAAVEDDDEAGAAAASFSWYSRTRWIESRMSGGRMSRCVGECIQRAGLLFTCANSARSAPFAYLQHSVLPECV